MHAAPKLPAKDKLGLVRDTINAALVHADFYASGAEVKGADLAQVAIVAAVTTENPHVVPAIAAKLIAFDGLDITVARQRVKSAILPLAAALGHTVAGSPVTAVPGLPGLWEKAIQIIMDNFAERPQDAERSHAPLLLSAVAACSEATQVLVK